MIVISDNREEEFPLSVNIGRPDLLDDEDFENWERFQSYVRHVEIPIVVNPVFFMIDGFIDEKQGYSGSGFAYTFWFRNMEDVKLFTESVVDIFGKHCYDVIKQLNPNLENDNIK